MSCVKRAEMLFKLPIDVLMPIFDRYLQIMDVWALDLALCNKELRKEWTSCLNNGAVRLSLVHHEEEAWKFEPILTWILKREIIIEVLNVGLMYESRTELRMLWHPFLMKHGVHIKKLIIHNADVEMASMCATVASLCPNVSDMITNYINPWEPEAWEVIGAMFPLVSIRECSLEMFKLVTWSPTATVAAGDDDEKETGGAGIRREVHHTRLSFLAGLDGIFGQPLSNDVLWSVLKEHSKLVALTLTQTANPFSPSFPVSPQLIHLTLCAQFTIDDAFLSSVAVSYPRLHLLRLSGCVNASSPAGWTWFAQTAPLLTTLEFELFELSPAAWTALGKHATALENVRLCEATTQSAAGLAALARGEPRLKRVALYNKEGDDLMMTVAPDMHDVAPMNHDDEEEKSVFIDHVVDFLAHAPALIELDLFMYHLPGTSVLTALACGHTPDLRRLMVNCRTCHGATVTRMLHKCPFLTHLSLCCGEGVSGGMTKEDFFQAFSVCRNLKHLELHSCLNKDTLLPDALVRDLVNKNPYLRPCTPHIESLVGIKDVCSPQMQLKLVERGLVF